jgi:predicted amino acid dehydrogenase
MNCAIVSRAGQVLARGKLLLDREANGETRLNLKTNGGKLIEGGIVDEDGDLTTASDILFQNCYEVWRMTGLTLTVTIR